MEYSHPGCRVSEIPGKLLFREAAKTAVGKGTLYGLLHKAGSRDTTIAVL